MRLVRVKIQLGAHEKFSAFKPLDLEQNRSGQSELKILVSVVRFRPGPPSIFLQAATEFELQRETWSVIYSKIFDLCRRLKLAKLKRAS
jgi:hypothetical protein